MDVSGCQWILASFIWDEVKVFRYCLALFISELMKMISFQYNYQCMLLVSYRWLTSYASKWGGGSKAVLASSGWLKIGLISSKSCSKIPSNNSVKRSLYYPWSEAGVFTPLAAQYLYLAATAEVLLLQKPKL